MRLRQRFVMVLLTALLPVAAQAQAWQCRPPHDVAVPPPPQPDGPVRRMAITGYSLALSWSPEFCRTHQDEAAGDLQCDGHIGRFGFVLHGLWPDGANGSWPQWCGGGPVPPETARRALCQTPSPGLIAHEWAKHGTCMAASPEAYFAEADKLFAALHFPDMARLSHRPGLTVGDLRKAMVALNPGMRPDAIRVLASTGDWLQEMHICLGTDRKPVACDRRGQPDVAPLHIWHSFENKRVRPVSSHAVL